MNLEDIKVYDPCRLFRKGDKVKAVLRHGRIPNDGVPKDAILEVIADERDGIVKVLHKMGVILEIFNVYALYLELVTPVEELDPYFVEEGEASFLLKKGDKLLANYWPTHPHAKAAAEAERDRLNSEYRKEREIRNGIIEIDKALNKEILNHADAFLTRKEQSNA